MSDSRGVTIHPAHKSGDPHIGGIPVYLILGTVWHGGVDYAVVNYEQLTREDVLTACWFAGIYGVETVYRHRKPYGFATRPNRKWARRWGQWAREHHSAMWQGQWDDIPDPPTNPKGTP